jgi:hypothetical protein
MGGKTAPAILVETKETPQNKTQAIRAKTAWVLSVMGKISTPEERPAVFPRIYRISPVSSRPADSSAVRLPGLPMAELVILLTESIFSSVAPHSNQKIHEITIS